MITRLVCAILSSALLVTGAGSEEKSKTNVEQRQRAGRDAGATDDLERHAPDEQIPVRKEAAAQVTAEEMQAVIESAKHAHQRRGRFHRELEMLRRVENQRRVKDGEPQRRKDLDKKQHRGSLGSRGESMSKEFHIFDGCVAGPSR